MPRAPRHHGLGTRGIEAVPQAPFFEGRFGRMFPHVPVFTNERGFLRELADAMQAPPNSEADNPDIPAGFTYLGQFVDHDITFDPSSSLERFNDPEGLVNFRTPRFDLDSLYGRGPDDEPFLYDQEAEDSAKFLIGKVREDDGSIREEDDLPRNLPRNDPPFQGRALIGDPRNDENTFVSQLQLVFLKFHNAVVDRVRAEEGLEGDELFKEAQRLTRWHYQWVVVHDFLPRIVGPELFNRLLRRDADGSESVHLRFYRPKVRPFMPIEFSVAAYRYGHSQVRGGYKINNTVPGLPTFKPGPLLDRRQDFRGFRGLPPFWTIDWPFFFELDQQGPQPSLAINTKLAAPLFALPDEEEADEKSLARRNLLRGRALKVPSGQRVADALGARRLTAGELGFNRPAPLWFYVLKEAELREEGRRLGAVGGRIVGETFLGLLRGDPLSYLSVQPHWRPTLPAASEDDFTMADLIRFAVPNEAVRKPQAGG